MTYAAPHNLTTMESLMNYADSVSGGSFYILVPISFFTIIFLYLKSKNYHSSDCTMAAGFLTSLITTMLFFIGGLSGHILFWTIAITFLAAIWGMWSNKDN